MMLRSVDRQFLVDYDGRSSKPRQSAARCQTIPQDRSFTPVRTVSVPWRSRFVRRLWNISLEPS
jgi:hypothetical protein